MMRKIKIVLFAVFLFLVNVGIVFAEDVYLGTWNIESRCPQLVGHYVETDFYNDGTQQTFEWDGSPHEVINVDYFPTIIQKPDGSIYGSYNESGGVANDPDGYYRYTWNLTGVTDGNSVIFKVTSVEDLHEYGSIYNNTCTKNFSGTISGHTLTGTIMLSYTSEAYLLGGASTPNLNHLILIGTVPPTEGTFSIDLPVLPIPPQNMRQNPSSDSQLGASSDPNKTVGDPINSVTGNMHIITSDLTIPVPGINISFVRTYNNQANQSGALGFNWTHSYNVYLSEDVASNKVKIKDEEAKGYIFSLSTDGAYIPQWGEYSTLTKNTSGFVWTKKSGKTYLFDLSGRLIQIKDRNNNAVNLSYNSQNRLTAITDTCGHQISLSYDASGRIATLTGPLGRTITYNYDSQGDLIAVIDPMGNSTSYEYDANHNITRKIDPIGKAIYFTYDSLNRCTSSSGEGNVGFTGLSFDPDNKKTEITDSKGNITTQYYNDDLLITRIVNSQGNETRSSWDPNFNLIFRTDKLNNTTMMQHDSNGNLSNVTDSAGNSTQFTYEPNFNLIQSSTDALGNVTTYARDANGNPTTITDAYGNSIHYTYNAKGQATSIRNALGNTTYFTYDTQGNLTQTQDSQGNVTTFSYDAIGNLTQTKDAKGNTTSFVYDHLNQVTETTYPDNTQVNYAYDAVGNRTSVTDAYNNTTDYTYDQAHHILSTTNALGNTVSYNYDTEENLTSVTDQNNNTTTYEYDSLKHLISRTDALNNRTQYEYDAAGNRTSVTDAKGQVTNFRYDSMNRLIRVTSLRGSEATEAIYAYDPLDRRVSKTVNGATIKYLYDGDDIIAEYNGSGSLITKYVYGDSIDEPICMGKIGTVPEGGLSLFFYHYDGLGSVTNLTDSKGAKVESYSYDAFGKPSGVSLIGNSRMFTGREYDSETGLYYYRERYYSSSMGRFLQADPLGIDDENTYSYCYNDPVNYVDPYGLLSLSFFSGIRLNLSIQPFPVVDITLIHLPQAGDNAPIVVGTISSETDAQDNTDTTNYAKNGTGDENDTEDMKEHTKGKRGSTEDKHTKPRPGRATEGKRQHPTWRQYD